MTRIIKKTLPGLALAVTITVSTFFANGDAAAFTNTIHPIKPLTVLDKHTPPTVRDHRMHPTVRDHRGPDGAPQGGVTVDGKAAKVTKAANVDLGGLIKYPWICDNGGSNCRKIGIVRDHR